MRHFKPRYTEVLQSKMHYVDEGKGDPMLFLHGNPTHSYLWRNIIPPLTPYARCIAPDLIGHGSSDKPAIDYRFSDHYSYLEAFIKKLQLNNITLVLHDWGSALGFYYAMQNQDHIKAICFMESIVRPWKWSGLKFDYKLGFRMLRTPIIGECMIYGLNAFLNVIMPQLTIRKLSSSEKKAYKVPFRKIPHRKPMLAWPREVPLNGKPREMHAIISQYSSWLQRSTIPKLLLYAEPGAIIDRPTREWCLKNMPNLTTVYLGKGWHYLPEDQPREISKTLRKWL